VFKDIVVKLLKAKWASLLASVFRAAGEGSFGPQVKATYWWLAGKKTAIGAVLVALSEAFSVLGKSDPVSFPWAEPAGKTIFVVGTILASLGLADGLTREEPPQG